MNGGTRRMEAVVRLLRVVLAFGSASALLAVTGCGGGVTGVITATPVLAPTHGIYVVQHTRITVAGAPQSAPDQILLFPIGANGSVAPTSTLTMAKGSYVTSLAADGSGNLFVGIAGTGAVSILVYAPGSSGTAQPTRTIAGPATGLDTVEALTVDASGQIFAAAVSSISVFAPNATGNVAPARIISMPATLLSAGDTISATTLDSSGGLYVALSTAFDCHIVVLPPSSSGMASPARTIGGNKFGFGGCTGLAVDVPGTIYTSVSQTPLYDVGYIYEFPPAADGNVAPTERLDSFDASTSVRVGVIAGLALDGSGSLYTVSDTDAVTGMPGLLIFPQSGTLSGPIKANVTSTVWTGATLVLAMY